MSYRLTTDTTHQHLTCATCRQTKRFVRGDDRAMTTWKSAHRCWQPETDDRKPWFVS